MTVKPIKNEADYDAALARIDALMDADPDTPEADEFEVLVTLVEAYEAIHWPIEPPDPISAIEHVMEARGLRQKDLAVPVDIVFSIRYAVDNCVDEGINILTIDRAVFIDIPCRSSSRDCRLVVVKFYL